MISWTSYRRDIVAGARGMTPWLVGLTPFGLVIGVSAAQADIPTLAGWLSGPLIFAGSAQVATIQMLDGGAAASAVVLTALVINLRLVLYSAAMAKHWRGTPLWWRLLGGYLLVDPSFVVGTQGYGERADARRGHAYYLGGAAVLWVTWLAAIAAGATAGAELPAGLHLGFLITLYLVGEVVSKVRQQPRALLTVVAASVVTLLTLGAPLHLSTAIGIIAGLVIGLLSRVRMTGPTTASQQASLPPLSVEEDQR